MQKMEKVTTCVIVALFLAGCASITNSKFQPVSVDASYIGKEVSDAKCSLINDKGKWYVSTPGSVMVQKSYGDMTVTCKKNGIPTGIVGLQSSSNGGVWGNILAGGIIGYAVDSSSGAGFDYPTNINVEMGKNISLKPKPTTNASGKPVGDYDNLNR